MVKNIQEMENKICNSIFRLRYDLETKFNKQITNIQICLVGISCSIIILAIIMMANILF